MKTTPLTEAEAQRVSSRKLLPAGWHDARITEAIERVSKRGNDTIEITGVVTDAEGNERTLRDWLTNTALGAAKLRHAAEAVGALAKYEAGELDQSDFPGPVRVKLGIEKKRGSPDRYVILDYAPSDSSVVDLRQRGNRP